jgi:copper chaperone
LKYSVPDISCGHCKTSIEKAVATLDPAATIAVDLETKTVAVTTARQDAEVVAALAKIGFPAQPA